MLLEPDLVSPALVLPTGAEFGGPLVRPVLASGGAPLPAVVLATLNTSSASAASLAPPTMLVGAGALGAGVVVMRAQTPSGARSTALDADGVTWSEFAADMPRFHGASRRLMIGGQRTNSIRNPRAGYSSAPTFPTTTPPDNWLLFGNTGMSATFIGSGIENGQEYVDVRFSGAAPSAIDSSLSFDTATSIAAAASQIWTVSFSVRLIAGSLANVSNVRAQIVENTSGGVFVAGSSSSFTPTASVSRPTHTRTLTGGTTAAVRPQMIVRPSGAGAVDATFRVSWPQIEQGSFASSPILPPVGTPAASTRGADVPIWTPAPMPARGAILLRGTLDALAGASALGLVHLDDGTDSNRIVARVAAGGGQPECLVVTSGVTLATLTPAGALTAASESRVLLAWSPGGVRFGTSAGGVASASVARPPGLVRGLLGHANAAGTLPISGEIVASLYDYWPSEAEALALLAA